MMFARLIKILTIAVSPKDLKEDFRDMIWYCFLFFIAYAPMLIWLDFFYLMINFFLLNKNSGAISYMLCIS